MFNKWTHKSGIVSVLALTSPLYFRRLWTQFLKQASEVEAEHSPRPREGPWCGCRQAARLAYLHRQGGAEIPAIHSSRHLHASFQTGFRTCAKAGAQGLGQMLTQRHPQAPILRSPVQPDSKPREPQVVAASEAR